MVVEKLDLPNRDEWLKARQKYVMATEVHALVGGSPESKAWQSLKRKKLGKPRDFDNRYMAWGREREDIVLRNLMFTQEFEKNGDVIWVRGRHGATPDGVAYVDGQVVLCEVKTTGKDWWWTDDDATRDAIRSNKPEYVDQMQWQMHVTGAQKCLFAWEVRHTTLDDRFYPGATRAVWFERDQEWIDVLVDAADRFLEFLDEPSEAKELDREWADEWAIRYIQADAACREAQKALDEAKEALQVLKDEAISMADGVEAFASGSDYELRIPQPSIRRSFDREAFDAEYPRVYEKYMTKETSVTPRVSFKKKEGNVNE